MHMGGFVLSLAPIGKPTRFWPSVRTIHQYSDEFFDSIVFVGNFPETERKFTNSANFADSRSPHANLCRSTLNKRLHFHSKRYENPNIIVVPFESSLNSPTQLDAHKFRMLLTISIQTEMACKNVDAFMCPVPWNYLER